MGNSYLVYGITAGIAIISIAALVFGLIQEFKQFKQSVKFYLGYHAALQYDPTLLKRCWYKGMSPEETANRLKRNP